MQRTWKTLAEEPLILFSILGGVFFVIYGFSKPASQVETITVRSSTIRALESMQQDLTGRTLTDQERQDVVEGFIEDEVLIHEAFRMELQKKDPRVRKRLLDVMRSTLDQPVAPPTRAQLQAYFRQHQERYTVGETITFDHVFFSYDSDVVPEDAEQLLASLSAGEDPTQFGDSTLLGRTMRNKSQKELQRMLGHDFAKETFALPLNQWRGPIESRQGIHFVKVTEKRAAVPPKFGQLEEFLRQDWTFRKRREIQTEKIAEMRQRYRVVFHEER